MENPSTPISPGYIINIVLRRYGLIIVSFCLAVIVGIVLVVKLPRLYRADTLILIEPQRVPKTYVEPIVTSEVGSRINLISQQIKSETNLEKIIEKFRLYSGPKYKQWYLEDKVANLRESISVSVITKGRRDPAQAFSIEFQGENPLKVMQVTNSLATYFIDENLKSRETLAIGTSDFLDDELTNMRNRLAQLEEFLKDYRKKYMGALPEQLETNLRVLDRFQEQLAEKEQSLREAKNMMIALDKQISEASGIDPALMPTTPGGMVFRPSEPSRLDALKNELRELESKYTFLHPDIRRLKRSIADLESQQENTAVSPDEPVVENTPVEPEPRYQMLLKARQGEIQREIQILEADVSKIIQTIQIYEKRVEDTPKREQELLSLQRDYANIKETYNSLLNRKLESEIAVNMEKKQKGEQFRVIDYARLPQKPFKPNLRRLFLLTIGAGLAFGCGLIILLEHLDTSFRRHKDIETYLGLPVMATLPVLPRPRDIFTGKLKTISGICGVVLSVSLTTVFFAFTRFGIERTITFVRRFIDI